MKFSDSLDRNLEAIERPPVLPLGHYIWQIEKYELDEFESRNGTPFERVTFIMVCASAHDDVDPDELEAYGSVSGAKSRKTFLFSNDPDEKANFERSMYNIKQFLEHCGVDGTLPMGEALASSVNASCLGEVKHRPDPNDPEIVYAEIGKTAPV